MAHHGQSGRVVIDVDPERKRELYAALSLEGKTLKEWFMSAAAEFCSQVRQPSLFSGNTDSGNGGQYALREVHGAIVGQNVHIRHAPGRNGEVLGTRVFRVVSMFSGCGGMDLGFQGGFQAFGRVYDTLPFKVVWANDLNKAACSTYSRNLGHGIACDDVWNVMDSLPKKADVVIGGFPCQDISVNGKMVGVNGSRSGLYKAMVEAIRRLRPRVFVAENVKGLLMKTHKDSLEQVLKDFGALGYRVHHQLYHAADYGIPQRRERVLIVGTSKGVKPFVPPPRERDASNWMSAREAIGDLEGVSADPSINHIWSFANVSPEQGNRRLVATKPAQTIRAECHGNIQFHYRLRRRLSMREAARFQSFPDSFIFEGGLRETERQVGNAVPPVLAWHLARAVLRCLI